MNTMFRTSTSGRVSVQTLAECLIRRCVQAERQFIAGFWLNPAAGHDAAVDAELSALSFSDLRLRVVFIYLCRTVELSIAHTIEGCLALASRLEPGMLIETEGDWLFRLVLGTDTEAGRVDHYAGKLRRLTDIRRGSARIALKTFAELATEDEFDVSVTLKRLLPRAANGVIVRKGLRHCSGNPQAKRDGR